VGFRVATVLIRLNYLVLAPWIAFSIPSLVFFGLQVLVVLIVSAIGSLGMLAKREAFARAASLTLFALMIAGKVGGDLLGAAAPDTAVLLSQFVAVIFFMEASRVVLSFDRENGELAGKQDELSTGLMGKLVGWAQGQLVSQARIMLVAVGLSLLLLVIGGFSSISINQLGFSAALVLVVVGVLLFLVTQRREPETQPVRLSR
jgi:hypothetical protein